MNNATMPSIKNFFCENYYVGFIIIFFVFLACLILATRKSEKINAKHFLCSIVMAILSLAISKFLAGLASIFFFEYAFNFVRIFGINPPLATAMGAPPATFIDIPLVHIALFSSIFVPNLLLQFWIPFFIFQKTSRKKMVCWVIISIFIVSLIYFVLWKLCPFGSSYRN